MATIFKYQDKYYQAANLNKKLKRLKVQSSDIEILFEGELSQSELEKKYLEFTREEKEVEHESWHNPTLYKYYDSKTKETIISIYPTLDDLKNELKESYYDFKRTDE